MSGCLSSERTAEVLREVYPERSEWAQDDTAQGSFVQTLEVKPARAKIRAAGQIVQVKEQLPGFFAQKAGSG
jgi:hypothetical protein